MRWTYFCKEKACTRTDKNKGDDTKSLSASNVDKSSRSQFRSMIYSSILIWLPMVRLRGVVPLGEPICDYTKTWTPPAITRS
jgi:hypothetical protein